MAFCSGRDTRRRLKVMKVAMVASVVEEDQKLKVCQAEGAAG